jgi:predicted aspartyl protease
MGIDTMGKVLVTAKIENLYDLFKAKERTILDSDIRRVEVDDALVDMGATGLSMPRRLIQQLGLEPLRMRQARTSAGPITVPIHGTVRLTIQGRDCPTEVMELADDGFVVIGRIALHAMDLVVDPSNQRLIGNPEHGGEDMLEMY